MFKPGDIVYCVKNDKMKYSKGLDINVPYIVTEQDTRWVTLDGIKYVSYNCDCFISEKEYQRGKRLEKILKLKECLN